MIWFKVWFPWLGVCRVLVAVKARGIIFPGRFFRVVHFPRTFGRTFFAKTDVNEFKSHQRVGPIHGYQANRWKFDISGE